MDGQPAAERDGISTRVGSTRPGRQVARATVGDDVIPSEVELPSNQERTLRTLVERFAANGDVATGEEIATVLGGNQSTVGDRLRGLKARGLVESVRGPNGGYRPTVAAYEVLDFDVPDDLAMRIHGSDPIVGLETPVGTVDILNLGWPSATKVVIRFYECAQDLVVDDRIEVGPLPGSSLLLVARIEEIDHERGTLLAHLETMSVSLLDQSDDR